jgi:hypothetical protein
VDQGFQSERCGEFYYLALFMDVSSLILCSSVSYFIVVGLRILELKYLGENMAESGIAYSGLVSPL